MIYYLQMISFVLHMCRVHFILGKTYMIQTLNCVGKTWDYTKHSSTYCVSQIKFHALVNLYVHVTSCYCVTQHLQILSWQIGCGEFQEAWQCLFFTFLSYTWLINCGITYFRLHITACVFYERLYMYLLTLKFVDTHWQYLQ